MRLICNALALHDPEIKPQDCEKTAPKLRELREILDEAQRIKNWRTKTADKVKRLRSPYAFVLTGTPLENRLDELYSVLQVIDPNILGPLWRFNQRYYETERRPSGSYKVLGYKNLDELRHRIAPYVLRRVREEVLLDLPERIDSNFFVEMTDPQWSAYAEYEQRVAQLMARARRRPLTPKEHKILLGALVNQNAPDLQRPGAPRSRDQTPGLRKDCAQVARTARNPRRGSRQQRPQGHPV
jgi:SNF2 family DNA or RNA helicase